MFWLLLFACEPSPHPQDDPTTLAAMADSVTASVLYYDANEPVALVTLHNEMSVLDPEVADDARYDGALCPVIEGITGTIDGTEVDSATGGGWSIDNRNNADSWDVCVPASVSLDCGDVSAGEVRLTDTAGGALSIDVTDICTPRTASLADPSDGRLVAGDEAIIVSSVATDTWASIDDEPVYLRWAEGVDGWTTAEPATSGSEIRFTVPDEVPATGDVELWPHHTLHPAITRCEGAVACSASTGKFSAYSEGVILTPGTR